MVLDIPCEMIVFPIQRHIGDSIIVLEVDPSYHSAILSPDELVSLHMANVLDLYLFNQLIQDVGDSSVIDFYTQDCVDRLVWDVYFTFCD